MLSQYLEILRDVYDAGEARAVFYRLVEDRFGLSRTDVCLGALNNLTAEQKSLLDADLQRLAEGEPVQYVVGYEWFHGMKFRVEKGVLIPRPETEELVDLIIDKYNTVKPSNLRILDIGCGSGAISVSLANSISGCHVTAWDVSDTALRITQQNASDNGVTVNAVFQDALHAPNDDVSVWDIIVSNPPYVCESEADTMQTQVKDYEPHLALFVSDDNPLLFYHAIANYAISALNIGGRLYFEINKRFGEETVNLLQHFGFVEISLLKDQYGKPRMVSARKQK